MKSVGTSSGSQALGKPWQRAALQLAAHDGGDTLGCQTRILTPQHPRRSSLKQFPMAQALPCHIQLHPLRSATK